VKVIADTCVWTHFLRRDIQRDDKLRRGMELLIREDAIQLLGCIRQELLSGAQPQERFERLRDYLRFYPNLPTDEDDDEGAAEYYNICRAKGVQGTATDLLICAVAVRHQMAIFTTDSDFDNFARYLPIDLHSLRRGG